MTSNRWSIARVSDSRTVPELRELAPLAFDAILLLARDRDGIVGAMTVSPTPTDLHRGEVEWRFKSGRVPPRELEVSLFSAAEDYARIEGWSSLVFESQSAAEEMWLVSKLGWLRSEGSSERRPERGAEAAASTAAFTKELAPTAEELVWRAHDAMEVRCTARVSEVMLGFADLRPGQRVLDLAAGRGEPAIRAADRVKPGGSVLGVDVSASMLKMARERARRAGVTNLELHVGNAESLDGIGDRSIDVVLARWCLMYFDAPEKSLAEARRVSKPGGVFVAAVWAEPERVSYFEYPRRILARHTTVPAVDLERPGTFRYSTPGSLERDLGAAGFSIVAVTELEVDVMEVESAPELIAWCRAFGMGRLLDPLPLTVQTAWERDVSLESESLRRDGKIRLGGTTRIVVARAGGP